jgi:hypothetical protein
MDPMSNDIYGTFHPTAEYTFFWNTQETSQIHYIQVIIKTHLNKFRRHYTQTTMELN